MRPIYVPTETIGIYPPLHALTRVSRSHPQPLHGLRVSFSSWWWRRCSRPQWYLPRPIFDLDRPEVPYSDGSSPMRMLACVSVVVHLNTLTAERAWLKFRRVILLAPAHATGFPTRAAGRSERRRSFSTVARRAQPRAETVGALTPSRPALTAGADLRSPGVARLRCL